MKFFLCILVGSFLTATINAQPPQMFKYQGIARTSGGTPMSNQSISIGINIHQGSAAGTLVYTETHSTSTDQFGMFNINVGGGTPTLGTFSSIRWNSNSYFQEVYLNGVSVGTSQLLSVPYALNASSSGFRAHMTSAVPMSANSSATINFDAVEFDDGNHLSAGAFTVPSTGFYHVESLIHLRVPAYNDTIVDPINFNIPVPSTPYNVTYNNLNNIPYNIGGGSIDAIIFADANPIDFMIGRSVPTGDGMDMVLKTSTNAYLTTGQIITVRVQNNSDHIGATVQPDFNVTYFSGYKIY